MYRQIIIPTESNNVFPVTIPSEWYGKKVEITASPVENVSDENGENKKVDYMKYFGAWESDKSAEEIIAEIRSSRTSGKTRILEEL